MSKDLDASLNRIADILSQPTYRAARPPQRLVEDSRAEHFNAAATAHHDPVASWDAKQEQAWGGLKRPEAQGHMPISEAKKFVDPVFRPWTKFHKQEEPYIGGLAAHVQERGVQIPIQITAATGVIFDGHHRLAAAERAGLESVPYRFVDKENRTVEPTTSWQDRQENLARGRAVRHGTAG